MPLLSEKAGEKIISRYKNTSRNQWRFQAHQPQNKR